MTNALFNVTLAFNTAKKAQDFWEKHRNQTMKDGGREPEDRRIDSDRTKTENHCSFLLRDSKRELIQQGLYADNHISQEENHRMGKLNTVSQSGWWVCFPSAPGHRPCGVSGPTSGANFGFRSFSTSSAGRGRATIHASASDRSLAGECQIIVPGRAMALHLTQVGKLASEVFLVVVHVQGALHVRGTGELEEWRNGCLEALIHGQMFARVNACGQCGSNRSASLKFPMLHLTQGSMNSETPLDPALCQQALHKLEKTDNDLCKGALATCRYALRW
eukprot:3540557-Amphidinium_carterae.3